MVAITIFVTACMYLCVFKLCKGDYNALQRWNITALNFVEAYEGIFTKTFQRAFHNVSGALTRHSRTFLSYTQFRRRLLRVSGEAPSITPVNFPEMR